jgi:hypothetical protein
MDLQLFARTRARAPRAGRRDNRRVGRSPHIDARRANERRRRARARTARDESTRSSDGRRQTRRARNDDARIPLTREEDVFEI